jgi:hypothetical protein
LYLGCQTHILAAVVERHAVCSLAAIAPIEEFVPCQALASVGDFPPAPRRAGRFTQSAAA